MKLCFGTFAKILINCMKEVPQDKLVALLARCVYANSSYIQHNYRYKDSSEGIEGDKSAISKIVNCKINFFCPNDQVPPTLNQVVKDVDNNVITLMGEKCKIKITLALIRLIENDESIEVEEKDVFQSIFGLNKEQFVLKKDFVFSDFLAKTLLYVTDREIKNTKGINYIKMITQKYIEDTLNAFAYVYEWDSINKTLTFSGYEILRCFENILNKNEIKYFIQSIDPTVSLDMDYWEERIESFFDDINNDIINVDNEESKVIQVINEFSNTLNEYFYYLSTEVIYTGEKGAPFAPKFRDENPKWSIEFANYVMKYKKISYANYMEKCTKCC